MSKSKKNKQIKSKTEKLARRVVPGRTEILCIILLVVLTYICYLNAFKNDFTNWDDNKYITNNPLIKSLSFENIKTMFSTTLAGNYHPFTVLSLAVDYHFYKLEPTGFHATNIIIHILNVVLVFFFIRLLSGKSLIAFITALLFGIHPMHVESVAWAAERKDVLYVFFYVASLCTYFLYGKQPEKNRAYYYFTLILFIFSLLSKGQAVTLPVVLLLIDYFTAQKIDKKIIFEKIPFLILSVAMGIVAFIAQKNSGGLLENPDQPFLERIFIAAYNFIAYISKMIYPYDLSAFYPYPDAGKSLPFYFYLSPLIIIALVYFIFKSYRKNKSLVFGFCFYIVNIFLLLQIVPVGGAMMSDRYTYLSYVGLFFVIGHGFNEIWQSKQKKLESLKYLIAAAFLFYVCFLGVKTWERNKVWKNSETLWTDVLRHNDKVVLAFSNRGNYYQLMGKYDLALADYNAALSLKDDYYDALISRCGIYRMNGQYDLVIKDCNKAISIYRYNAGAYINRGIAKSLTGKNDDALRDFNIAISLEPQNSSAYANRGFLLEKTGQLDAAIKDYSKAITINPEYTFAYLNRGKAFYEKGNFDAAISDFNTTISFKNNSSEIYYFRSQAFNAKKDYANALNDALTAKHLGIEVDTTYLNDLQKRQ